MATTHTQQYPKTEQAIRAFRGPADAGLRRLIRQALAANLDVRTLARTVALTALGRARLEAVWQAWHEENPIIER